MLKVSASSLLHILFIIKWCVKKKESMNNLLLLLPWQSPFSFAANMRKFLWLHQNLRSNLGGRSKLWFRSFKGTIYLYAILARKKSGRGEKNLIKSRFKSYFSLGHSEHTTEFLSLGNAWKILVLGSECQIFWYTLCYVSHARHFNSRFLHTQAINV